MVPCALAIFEELGFLTISGLDSARSIEMVQSPGKVEPFSQSIRYLEGIRARVEFSAFRGWALSASAHDMLANVNRPRLTPRVR